MGVVILLDPISRLEVSMDKEGLLLVMMSQLDNGFSAILKSGLRVLDFFVSIDNTAFSLVVLFTAVTWTGAGTSVILK
jgi:hypothetical protein